MACGYVRNLAKAVGAGVAVLAGTDLAVAPRQGRREACGSSTTGLSPAQAVMRSPRLPMTISK